MVFLKKTSIYLVILLTSVTALADSGDVKCMGYPFKEVTMTEYFTYTFESDLQSKYSVFFPPIGRINSVKHNYVKEFDIGEIFKTENYTWVRLSYIFTESMGKEFFKNETGYSSLGALLTQDLSECKKYQNIVVQLFFKDFFLLEHAENIKIYIFTDLVIGFRLNNSIARMIAPNGKMINSFDIYSKSDEEFNKLIDFYTLQK